MSTATALDLSRFTEFTETRGNDQKRLVIAECIEMAEAFEAA